MPKGQSPKLKGALCTVPIDIGDVCKTLPRPADSNGIVIVKLKRKLQYRSHVYFESLRPNFIMRLLQHLKLNNSLYHDIEINLDNVPNLLINEKSQDSLLLNVFSNIDIHEEILTMVEKNDSSEEAESDIESKSSNTPIPIVFENCECNQDSNLITIVTNIEKPDISSNLNSDITNSIAVRIDGNDRKDDGTNFDNKDNNSNIFFEARVSNKIFVKTL